MGRLHGSPYECVISVSLPVPQYVVRYCETLQRVQGENTLLSEYIYVPPPFPHLRNDKLACDQQRPQQVVSAVVPHLIDRHLKTERVSSQGEQRMFEKAAGTICSFLFFWSLRPISHSSTYLRPGEDDWFAQMFTHEGQGRGGVRHSVCAVQDHKTVIVFVVFLEKKKYDQIFAHRFRLRHLFFFYNVK